MTLLLIIGAVLFTLFAIVSLLKPFVASRRDQLRYEVLHEDLRRVEALVAHESTLLQSLRELEFDHDLGKLTDEDYKDLKRRYERQAVKVMRELDELHGGRGWETAIDEQLDKRRQQLARQRQAEEARALSAATPAIVDCPECGKQMDSDARFCSQCGATLPDPSASSQDQNAGLESHAIPSSGSEVAT